MKELKRRKGLNGTVLIMILTVMIVLIIMLVATLTVVTTANRRIYTKFEENQAYYTARSALDIFVDKMLVDADYISYDGLDGTGSQRMYEYTDYLQSPPVETDAPMKQGLAIQGEFYKIKSQGIQTAEIVNAPGSGISLPAGVLPEDALGFVENPKEAEDVFGGSTPEDEFFSIAVDGTDPAYDYIIYKITLPKITDGSNSYGGFVDKDPDTDEQIATIKVEVLDRVFDTSPAYTKEDMINIVNGGNASAIADLKTAIKNGDRTNDKVRLKITSTVQFMGFEGTAVLITDSFKPPQVSSSRAVTSLSDIKEADSLNMVGGASSLTGQFSSHNDAMIIGDAFTAGNIADNSSTHVAMVDQMAHLIAMGTITWRNALPVVTADGVLMYAYDGYDLYKGGDYGDSTHHVNIVTPGEIIISDQKPKINGNTYAGTVNFMGANVDTRFNGNSFTNNVIFNESAAWIDEGSLAITLSGDLSQIFSGGPFNVASGQFSLARRDYAPDWSSYTDTITRTFRVISPTSVQDVSSLQIYAVSGMPTNLTFNTSLEVKVDYFDGSHYSMTDDKKKEFTVPSGNLAGSGLTNKFEIPTLQNMYQDYFDPSAFIDESATPGHGGEFNFVSIADMKAATASADVTLKEAVQNALAANILTAEDKFGGPLTPYSSSDIVTLDSRDATTDAEIDSSISDIIRSSGMLEARDYGLVAIDARSSNITLQLGDGSSNWFTLEGKFIIYGTKAVTFLLPAAADGSPITYNFGDTSGRPSVIGDSQLVNVSEAGGGSSSVFLSLGTGGSTAAPNVDILAGENANISVGTSGFITGYIYAPQSSFEIAGGANGCKYEFSYSGYTPASGIYPTPFNVIGSVLCLDYKSAQKVGVCYISRDVNNHEYGNPYLDWKPYRYARN